jgi:hypothetical protein
MHTICRGISPMVQIASVQLVLADHCTSCATLPFGSYPGSPFAEHVQSVSIGNIIHIYTTNKRHSAFTSTHSLASQARSVRSSDSDVEFPATGVHLTALVNPLKLTTLGIERPLL